MSEEFFDYEHQEPRNNLIAFLLISSCIFVVAACAFMAWMFSVSRENEKSRKLLQANYVELQSLRKDEEAKLSSYQYIDKDKGVVRIPVERAMQVLAEEAKSAAPKAEAVVPAATPAPVVAKPEVKVVATKPTPPAVVPAVKK